VYADGSLTPESTGSRYTELITHSLLNSSGGGFDDRTLVSSGPILNHLGDAIGSSTSTTTLDHSVNEGHLRDFRTSDRSDWRFDLATGTLVPTQRVQVDSHVIDVSLDLVHDTTVQTQRAGSYTLDQRNHEFEGESESRTREAISSGQNSTRTVTRTTPHEGPGAGVTILVVSGTDDVSHHDFAWLQSHSGVSTSEIHGSDGYYRYQTDTDDTLRTTFDSVHSVQRIDGSGDTRYQGNRGLAGDGWNSDWYEETPSGGGIEVSQGSYHLALTHDDDRPNAYDLTVASGSPASVELPGPYRLPTNPQANTPPSDALGPGGFSPPEDPSGVAALRAEVSTAGHNASGDNVALEEYFTTLVTGVEQLGSELGDENYEYGGSSRTPSEPASDYGSRSSVNVPSLGKPNFAQLIESANSTFPAEPALPPPGEHATPYMLVSAPTANRSLLQSFTGWLDDWFSGLMGTPTAEERARLNREALQGPRPDLIVGQGFTPETLAQMGQAQIGQSRFLDGKYGRGSITAYEVGINTIEYSQASIKEVVLAVAGAKLAEFGIQGGRWALTKTPAGQWVVKQGENAVVLTADQVKKLRDAIRNGIKGVESLADNDVDKLLQAPTKRPWSVTASGSSKVIKHDIFGKFYKSKSDGLWWAVDNAGHGGSAFKVFKETGKGLEWIADADRFGDFIAGKHKGPTGLIIPWGHLRGF
jgi:hypothetical protein